MWLQLPRCAGIVALGSGVPELLRLYFEGVSGPGVRELYCAKALYPSKSSIGESSIASKYSLLLRPSARGQAQIKKEKRKIIIKYCSLKSLIEIIPSAWGNSVY